MNGLSREVRCASTTVTQATNYDVLDERDFYITICLVKIDILRQTVYRNTKFIFQCAGYFHHKSQFISYTVLKTDI